jgi:hypothetical protein
VTPLWARPRSGFHWHLVRRVGDMFIAIDDRFPVDESVVDADPPLLTKCSKCHRESIIQRALERASHPTAVETGLSELAAYIETAVTEAIDPNATRIVIQSKGELRQWLDANFPSDAVSHPTKIEAGLSELANKAADKPSELTFEMIDEDGDGA